MPTELYAQPLDKAVVLKEGNDITVISYGDGLVAAYEALSILGEDVSVELIDLVSINPVDHATVLASVRKTKRLLCVDTTNDAFNVGSEVIAKVAQEPSLHLEEAPLSLACPNVPCPTSTALTESYYPTKVDVANAVLQAMTSRPSRTRSASRNSISPPTLTII